MGSPYAYKPRTAAQLTASRANGALSQGPVTLAGKTKISTNRMVHGFRSNSIALNNEESAAYDDHLDKYLARYAPIDKMEEDLVGLLASNMWQVMRNNSIEVALFNLAISDTDSQIKGVFADMDEYGRLALAFQKSAGDNALELLRRYKSTSERSYHRALQALEQIQKNRQPKPEDVSSIQTQDPHPLRHRFGRDPQVPAHHREHPTPTQPLLTLMPTAPTPHIPETLDTELFQDPKCEPDIQP